MKGVKYERFTIEDFYVRVSEKDYGVSNANLFLLNSIYQVLANKLRHEIKHNHTKLDNFIGKCEVTIDGTFKFIPQEALTKLTVLINSAKSCDTADASLKMVSPVLLHKSFATFYNSANGSPDPYYPSDSTTPLLLQYTAQSLLNMYDWRVERYAVGNLVCLNTKEAINAVSLLFYVFLAISDSVEDAITIYPSDKTPVSPWLNYLWNIWLGHISKKHIDYKGLKLNKSVFTLKDALAEYDSKDAVITDEMKSAIPALFTLYSPPPKRGASTISDDCRTLYAESILYSLEKLTWRERMLSNLSNCLKSVQVQENDDSSKGSSCSNFYQDFVYDVHYPAYYLLSTNYSLETLNKTYKKYLVPCMVEYEYRDRCKTYENKQLKEQVGTLTTQLNDLKSNINQKASGKASTRDDRIRSYYEDTLKDVDGLIKDMQRDAAKMQDHIAYLESLIDDKESIAEVQDAYGVITFEEKCAELAKHKIVFVGSHSIQRISEKAGIEQVISEDLHLATKRICTKDFKADYIFINTRACSHSAFYRIVDSCAAKDIPCFKISLSNYESVIDTMYSLITKTR